MAYGFLVLRGFAGKRHGGISLPQYLPQDCRFDGISSVEEELYNLLFKPLDAV